MIDSIFSVKKLLFFIGAVSLLSACVPVQKKTTCGSNETFNAALRTCLSATAVDNHFRPIGENQTESTDEDTSVDFVLKPGTDQDGDTIYYIPVTNPSKGTITNCMNKVGSTGLTDTSCTYTPSSNLNGTDTFTYKLNDGFQDSEVNLTVTIEIDPVNDPPVPTLQVPSPIIFEDSTTTYTIPYTDPENDNATSCAIYTSSNMNLGACSCTAGICQVSINPFLNENSTRGTIFSFTLSLSDIDVSNQLTQPFIVTAVNDAPVLTDATCITSLNQDDTISCTNASVSDPDTLDNPADVLTWSMVSGAGKCNWISVAAGVLSGTAADSNVGTCSLVYQVTDSSSASATSTPVTLTINNILPTLTANGNLTNATEDLGRQPIGIISSASGCSATTNAFCLAGDKVSYGIFSSGPSTTCTSGLIEYINTGVHTTEIYFTPNLNYSTTSPCIIQVQYTDNNAAATSASLTLSVTDVNDNPTITPSADLASQTTNEATSIVIDTDTATPLIDPFTIDEGGGSSEDWQSLNITISSDNTSLVPHSSSNIQIFSDSNYSTPLPLKSANSSGVTYGGDEGSAYVVITPTPGQSGIANFTMTVTDDGNPAASTTTHFIVTVTNKAVTHNDWSQIYAIGGKQVYNSTTLTSNPSVILQWNAFDVIGDSIASYNVYRSTSATGPFLIPLNSSSIATSARTYTDTSLTASDAGTSYYYKVMATSASNGKMLSPNENYSIIKVTIPPHNMALVHRRMANLEACTSMNTADAGNHVPDPTHSNRCAYVGPGDNYSGYFDIGADYFVDRYEASCNFTVNADDCPETGGVGCIGEGDPNTSGMSVASSNAIYYDRDSGSCHYFNGAIWKEIYLLTKTELDAFVDLNQTIQGTTTVADTTFPKRPPIVNIQQHKAHRYCQNVSVGVGTNLYKSLTSRLVHVAAAAWPATADIGTLETGATISLTTSQCNSSNGGNLNFQDSLISSLIDTWTATESSAVTSHSFVMSGSSVTNSCQSQYGIQDLAGNVDEWNLDRYFIVSNNIINPIGKLMNSYGNDWAAPLLNNANADYNPYSFGTGPSGAFQQFAYISSGVGFNLESFTFSTGLGSLTKIFAPLGLPTDIISSGAIAASSFSLFDDETTFNETITTATGDFVVDTLELLGVSSGGSFSDEAGAGRFKLGFRSVCHDDSNNALCDAADIIQSIPGADNEKNVNTGFRCMIEIP